jgi:DNA invertase Pin-like site-specific DNA recombinase
MSVSNPATPPAVPPHQISGKVRAAHLARLAVVYIRQSTMRQVLTNRESTDLQYKLTHRATELGWPAERVLVIDDDLGLSGASAADRAGFQRLLAEVSLNHVGLVLGLEMSRLARSGKDWHQLLELCALFGVLLADQDGLYDPGDYNDRLLLGLKGTMSEAELHLLRARMEAGRRNKAERGELFFSVPSGYVRLPGGEVTFDPDAQVQAVLRLVFAKFAELGSCRRVLAYFRRHHIRLPVRPTYGPNRGQLEWRPAAGGALYGILRNPTYAGAYAHGRSRVDPRKKRCGRRGSGRVVVPMAEWTVLLRDRLPAYITWEEYLRNRERLRQNQARFQCQGAVRPGPALLTGLVVCGRCGWRMYVHHNRAHLPRYVCPNGDPLRAEQRCPSVAGRVIDALVSQQVLRALQPASLALSLQAAEDLEREAERLDRHWQHELERARYQAERAKRQYDACEPENRLVVRELERRWEEALREAQKVEEEYDRLRREQPRGLSVEQRQRIEALAADIPALWGAPTTTSADRKEVVRQLVERVVVTVEGNTEVTRVAIHWAGGRITEHEVARPIRAFQELRDYEGLRARIKELRAGGKTAAQIAEMLNREGFRSAQRQQRFNKGNVRQLLCRWKLSGMKWKREVPERLRGRDEWWAHELVEQLGIALSTLCKWCRDGWVHARRVAWPCAGGGRWLVWADAEELERLRRLNACHGPGRQYPFPEELKTPKKREHQE